MAVDSFAVAVESVGDLTFLAEVEERFALAAQPHRLHGHLKVQC